MVNPDMARVGADDKAKRKRPATKGRFAFHNCFHHDAWAGLIDLDDGEVGVYWRIILLMYIRRSALPNDPAWLARQCNIPTRRCVARLDSLRAKGRIVIDTEDGLIFDERALKELVNAEAFSESQTERARRRWKHHDAPPKPALRVVENVGPAANVSSFKAAQIAEMLGGNSTRCSEQAIENIENGLCRSHANQNQNHIDSSEGSETVPAARRPPLKSGGAPSAPDPYPSAAADPKARMDAMKAALRHAYPDEFDGQEGDGAAPATIEEAQRECGDRRARRA